MNVCFFSAAPCNLFEEQTCTCVVPLVSLYVALVTYRAPLFSKQGFSAFNKSDEMARQVKSDLASLGVPEKDVVWKEEYFDRYFPFNDR